MTTEPDLCCFCGIAVPWDRQVRVDRRGTERIAHASCATQLPITKIAAHKSATPITALYQRKSTASTAKRPTPLKLKTVSVIMVPPIRLPRSPPMTVTSGIAMFASTCFSTTVRRGRPFAHAVRT